MERWGLDGRVIAVTGAAGSLGPVVAPRLASAGARLSLNGRRRPPLEELAREVGGAEVAAVDLLDAEATTGWADDLVRRHGHVDGLVHLVGGWRGGTPIEESPREDWDVLHAHLVSTTQNVTRAFARHLMASGRGRFVIVSSGQAQAPTHTNAAYAAAKAAAEAWTFALADRFRGTGATANVVVVGAIVTPRLRAESPERDFSTFTPAEEIAEAIAYLCSDAASSMNGQRLTLRGAA
ncbi:MAG: SDR family oxidoreductase [Thermoleophilia bacterium]|nr:SDR family oxidoreductase [Gaiellaceae bacterium]MDW8339058.1 SDR family oxidoreductase [Thermoleophilia bacterium]